MRDYLRACLITTCISFTVEMLAFVILPDPMVPELTKTTIFQTFAICICASFFGVYPFTKIENIVFSFVVSAMVLLSVILGLGSFIFHLIPFEWEVIGSIIGCLLVIYILSYFATSYKNAQDAKEINEFLQKLHKGEKKYDEND